MHGLHYETYTKLYQNLVIPVMDYAADIWGYKDHPKPNTVQHRAMRCFMGVGKFTAIPALYGEMCWPTPVHRRHADTIRYFVSIMGMDRNRLPHKVFMWDHSRARRASWSYEIKSILEQCGLGEIYQNLALPRFNMVNQVKRQLALQQRTTWDQSRIMPKLRTYNIMKTNWELPSYVKKYLTRIQRAHVAKLFSGNLPLRVETGRYRLYTHCNLSQVEDEIHFITSCELYTDIRVTLAESNGIDLAVDNISELFVNICNNVPPKELAQFIITAMQRRRIPPTLCTI